MNSAGVVSNGIDYEVDTVPVDDPTILILSGDLTLSNGTVTESSGFPQAAIRLTGGAITFGAGVTLNRQAAGSLIDFQTTGTIDATGVTFQQLPLIAFVGERVASPGRNALARRS